MTVTEWINSNEVYEKSKKRYAHFDYRTDIMSQFDYVSNPENVSKHGFYPFIYFEKKMIKYNKKKGKDPKYRPICYAAHIDRCIYQYYNFLLSELYNVRVANDGLNEVAVAYRNNLHMNNAVLAKKAFDFLKSQNDCYVMIGDFTNFFDTLNHQYLKERWCSLIGATQLPEDHYKVFKSLTRYGLWELEDLLKLNNLSSDRKDRKALNSKSKVLENEVFKSNKSHIKTNPNNYGIPQGSPMSGLLANVYMLEVDKRINELVLYHNGLYMRYSDDFIVILPKQENTVETIGAIIEEFNKTPNLTLEPNKTQYFIFEDSNVKNCGTLFHKEADCKKRYINFLGFTFDGKKVTIRSKTTFKYYTRMYRKAKTIAKRKGVTPLGNRISCANLYAKYSRKGEKKGNYLSYVNRSYNVFNDEGVLRDTKRHMQKIRKVIENR